MYNMLFVRHSFFITWYGQITLSTHELIRHLGCFHLFGYYAEYCYKHSFTCFCVMFISLGYIPGCGITKSYVNYAYAFDVMSKKGLSKVTKIYS